MRLAFIGGNGHHSIQGALGDPAFDIERPVAVAGDGYDEAAARRLAEALGATWFDTATAMFNSYQPGVVSIGAVYGHNGDFVAAALERDIPVASDKPIAATREQLARIKRLIDAKPSRTVVSEFTYRCDPAFCSAQQAVARGEIGRVVLATAQKSYKFGESRPAWYADRTTYGGTILWVASHAIDAVWFTTGRRITRVGGAHGNLTRPQYGSMEDHTITTLELKGGARGVVHADYLNPAKSARHGEDRLRLAGSEGVIEIRAGRCLLTTHTREEHDITDAAKPRPIHQEMLRGLHGESEAFHTAATLEMAAVLLAARDAADSGRTLAVEA